MSQSDLQADLAHSEFRIPNSEFAIDWPAVEKVLVIKLRSIGDTVLTTPSLVALRRFLPHAQIDILLEDWVAPLLQDNDLVDNVISVGKSATDKIKSALEIRARKYDVVFNQHGGSTSTFLIRATGAKHRVGYSHYPYSFFYTHLLSSSSEFWKSERTHSAEQQLALVGFVGVPVGDRPKSVLKISPAAYSTVGRRLECIGEFALFHPAAAFASKQWSPENFAGIAEHLSEKGIQTVAVVTKSQRSTLDSLQKESKVPIIGFDDLTLPEIAALASRAKVFVGNDSGIAHIAAAVGTPVAVVFGSSNVDHWRPWTDAPSEIVRETLQCQPCPGYSCAEFGEPRCILTIKPERVAEAVDRLLTPTT